MATAVERIPERYKRATPYLCIKDAAAALEFYKRAFGATETMRMAGPDGKVMHAEIAIGEALVMLADEFPEMGFRSPASIGGTPVTLYVYVDDVDAFVARAKAEGATVTQPVETKFYGDRTGQLQDPFGHVWGFATHVEDVPEEEIRRRFQAFLAGAGTA